MICREADKKQYESMEQTLVREVKEETGYEVSVDGFVALAEEINVSEEYRKLYPEYTHRILHGEEMILCIVSR